MQRVAFFKKIIFTVPMLMFLAGCGASEPTASPDPGVQDINPGDPSIIQTQAPQKSPTSSVGERSL